jgi:hypothetical protein
MFMTISKSYLAGILLLLSGAVLAAPAPALVPELAPEDEMQGTIQSLDFGSGTMIFEGIRFHMAPDLTVHIRGNQGAFTMLQPGMKAVVTFRVVSASERHAISIVQLPDNTVLEGA